MILTLKVTDNVNVCVSYCRVIRYRLSCSDVRYNEYAMLNVIVYLVLKRFSVFGVKRYIVFGVKHYSVFGVRRYIVFSVKRYIVYLV